MSAIRLLSGRPRSKIFLALCVSHAKTRPMKAPVVLMPRCCAQCTTTHNTWIVQNTLTRLHSLPHALRTKIWACACALRHNYTWSQSPGSWFNGYHLVRGSLVALASSSAIVNSYSCNINEIPSCKAIHCEQVCLQRSLRRNLLEAFEASR